MIPILRKGKRRAYLDLFIQELNGYDLDVQKILSMAFADDAELKRIRLEKEWHFDIIEAMMDEKLLGFSSQDMRLILRVNSFVDNCDQISHLPREQMDKEILYILKEQYSNRIKKARRICFLRLAS